MIPILFESTEMSFTSNGICRLSDIASCKVTEERNGVYECEFTYPVSGLYFSEIREGRIVACYHDDTKTIQSFDIYSRSQPINGLVTFYAHHVSYRLGKIVIKPFTANSCTHVFATLETESIYINNPGIFSFWTDKQVNGNFELSVPKSIREILGGSEGSILDTYGKGEYEFDFFDVKLYLNRGTDKDVTIRYGKNLTEFKYDSDLSEYHEAVAPYWQGIEYDGDTETSVIVTLPEWYVVASNIDEREINDQEHRDVDIVPLDLSSYFDSPPTESQLRSKAQSLLDNSTAWVMKESFDVSFARLWESGDYETYASLQRVNLCDKVTIINPNVTGIEFKMEVIKVVYDVIEERYKSMELGSPKKNFADSISDSVSESVNEYLKNYPTKSFMDVAIDHATKLITGGLGGHVVIKTNANGEPEEILIMDTTDPETAVKVWRWNLNGLGYSNHGYGGPYETAITMDGEIVASFITTGVLNAGIIRTGILTDALGNNYWNLDTGEIHIAAYSDVGVTNLLLDSMTMPTVGNTGWRVTPENYSTIVLDSTTGFAKADLLQSSSNIYTRVFGRTNKQIKDYVGQYITVSFDIENLLDPEVVYLEGETPTVCAFLNLRVNASDTNSFGDQLWKLDVDTSGIEGDEKKRLHVTFGPITSESFSAFNSSSNPFSEEMYLGVVIGVDRADHALVSKIKAERGTVATDWSQAPEDVADLEQKYATLSTSVDEISMEVGSYKSIGGTNLIRESREMPMSGTIKWSKSSSGTQDIPLDSESFSKVHFAANSYILRAPTRKTIGGYIGQKITFSFDVYTANAAAVQDIRAYLILVSNIGDVSPAEFNKGITIPASKLVAGKTTRVSVTFEPTGESYFTKNGTSYTYSNNKYMVFSIQDGDSSNAGELAFSRLKAEIGAVATDWSPAPEDIGSEFDDVEQKWSALSVTVDGINTEVGEKVGKDEIISRINQSAEAVSIDANKITFAGKVIDFTTTQINISDGGTIGNIDWGDDIILIPEYAGEPLNPIEIGGQLGYMILGYCDTHSIVKIRAGNNIILMGDDSQASANGPITIYSGNYGIRISNSGVYLETPNATYDLVSVCQNSGAGGDIPIG